MASKTVGDNIRRLREARGMLQKELGAKVGKKSATISNWELGLRDPGGDNIKLLAAALEVSPSEIIGHNEDIMQDSTFEVIAKDDSMAPEIKPGDLLTVSKSGEPKSGDIVVAEVETESKKRTLIRKLFTAGASYVLMALNPSFTPFSGNIKLKGKVTQIKRNL